MTASPSRNCGTIVRSGWWQRVAYKARRRRAVRAACLLAMGLAAACGQQPRPSPAPTHSTSATPLPLPRHGCTRAWGAYTDRPDIASLNTALHAQPAIVHQFFDLATPPTSAWLASVRAQGWLPLLALEPATLPDPLHTIIAGGADRQLAAWSKAVASFGAPVMIAPLPEMDLTSNAWGIGDHTDSTGKRYTNTAADIVAAFIKIHDRIVAQVGQEKVLWVFNPQGTPLGQGTARDWESFYPGDAYVSWVGLDVYNVAGAANPPRPWESLRTLLQAGAGPSDPGLYARMTRLAPHEPMMLAAFGTVEAGGDKAQWLHEAARDVANSALFPAIDAVVYFDGSIGSIDLHVATSPGALAAARSAFGVTSPYCLTGTQVVNLTNTGE